ncbi:MAG: sulfotransferase domain-containing protein [Planctomycetota bacterium]
MANDRGGSPEKSESVIAMGAAKTFLLGVGAQKAGTTWLHEYVHRVPSTRGRRPKEFHVWNAIDAAGTGDAATARADTWSRKDLLMTVFRKQPWLYFTYFSGLLSLPGTKLVTDITPTYSSLSAATFGRIRDGFAGRGVEVKVVFLMRDPVERLWSAVRMARRKRPDAAGRPDETEEIASYYATDHALIRGRYDRTVANLESVFEPESVFFGFFESLFDHTTLERLSGFLDVPIDVEFADRQYNVSAKKAGDDLPTHLAARIASDYREVYDFCGHRFPDSRNLWKGYALL